MYKWYEGKGEILSKEGMEKQWRWNLFLGTEYILCMREIESAVRVFNDILGSIGWQMERRGKDRKDQRRWY
jgi:hypothetical protein